MSSWLLWIVTGIYAYTGLTYGFRGDGWQCLVWLSYSAANLGLIMKMT